MERECPIGAHEEERVRKERELSDHTSLRGKKLHRNNFRVSPQGVEQFV